MVYTDHYTSPLGEITLAGDGTSLTGLWFEGQKHYGTTVGCKSEEKSLPVFAETKKWLDVYFSGKEPDKTPSVAFDASDFQKIVWELLKEIPYGSTVTYGEIAALVSKKTGKRSSARAVGCAVARNPVSVIVPCHRVVGAGGKLTGYAGGIDRKERLLALERSGKSFDRS